MEIKNDKKNNSIYEVIILKDMMLSEKYLSNLYNQYINEFSNSELSSFFYSLLNDISNEINKIKNILFSIGYNSFSISNENKINKIIYKYSLRNKQ